MNGYSGKHKKGCLLQVVAVIAAVCAALVALI